MRGKRRLVPIWIKILLLVFAVLFVLSASAGIWSIFALRQTTEEMPYPAVAGYQLYPVSQEIGIDKYPAGSLLLIRRQNHYSVGEELALPAGRNNISAAPFVRVTEIEGNELTVQQMAASETEMYLSSAEACGRVTHVIPVAGYSVAALFGEWNWLYFLVIPAAFLLAFTVTAICVAGSRKRRRAPSLAFSAGERFDLFEEDVLPGSEKAPGK